MKLVDKDNVKSKKKGNSSDEGANIEFQPSVPLNIEINRRKEEARKLAISLREQSNNTIRYIVTNSGEVKKESALTKKEQKDEYVKCILDPIYFIETYLTIFDQTKGDGGMIVPFKLFPFQKYLIKNYQGHRFNVANKYRQAGISTTTCAYLAWYICFNENVTVAVVANKFETARDELMADIVNFLNQLPNHLIPEIAEKDSEKHKIWKGNRILKAFAPSTLRGLTPTLMFWDETAWADKGEKFWTAARPAFQTGGKVIFVSTPSGLDPVFYKTFVEAKQGNNKFNAVELWWFNDPRYNENLSWVKNQGVENEFKVKDDDFTLEQRAKMVADGFVATSPWFENEKANYNGNMKQLAQELLCSFLGSGDNFVSEEYIKYADEVTVKSPLRQEYEDHCMWIWEDPIVDASYIQCIDVSSGNGEDFSVINILKIHEIDGIIKQMDKNGSVKEKKVKRRVSVQVAEYYNKQTPEVIGHIAYSYGKKYNNALTVVDITGGLGASTVSKMIELGYDNLYYSEVTNKPLKDRLVGYRKTITKEITDGIFQEVEVFPGMMITNNRGIVLLEMERAIRMKDFEIKSKRLSTELKTFVTVEGSRMADHRRSFHDDSIMSVSLGLYVVAYSYNNLRESVSKQKAMLNALTKVDNGSGKKTNLNEKTPENYVNIRGTNPYLANAWLFKGLDKKNR